VAGKAGEGAAEVISKEAVLALIEKHQGRCISMAGTMHLVRLHDEVAKMPEEGHRPPAPMKAELVATGDFID